MRDTFFKLWVHGIIKIHEQSVSIEETMSDLLYVQIEKNLKIQGCEVKLVNGISDHIHFLFEQNPLQSVHNTMQYVQKATEQWYRERDFNTIWARFRWQEGYAAFSVSPSSLEKVESYIARQKIIHEDIGYEEELKELCRKHEVDVSG